MGAGRHGLSAVTLSSVTLSAYLQYAFIIDATRGLYCLMMPRFLSAASGLAARPAVRAVSASRSSVSFCLAMSHDFASRPADRAGDLEQRGQAEQVVGRRIHLARRVRVLDRRAGAARAAPARSWAVLQQRCRARCTAAPPRSPWPGRRRTYRVLQERQRLLGPWLGPALGSAPTRRSASPVRRRGRRMISAWAAASAGTMAVVSLAMIRLVDRDDAVHLAGHGVGPVQVAQQRRVVRVLLARRVCGPLEQPRGVRLLTFGGGGADLGVEERVGLGGVGGVHRLQRVHRALEVARGRDRRCSSGRRGRRCTGRA